MNGLVNDEDRALETAARRVYGRYVEEFVEAFDICPWANRARLDGRTRVEVVCDAASDPRLALDTVADLSSDLEVEVGLILFPRLELDRLAFEAFTSELRALDAARYGLGGPAMAIAAFHPDAEARTDSAYQLVPFIRRTPDPTLQLVRRSVLDSVRKKGDHGTAWVDPSSLDLAALLSTKPKVPLHERVAQANLETLTSHGLEAIEALFLELRRDRDAAYREIEARFRAVTPAGAGD
jgi:hypothetical protein